MTVIWDGSSLVSLPESDPRRGDTSGCVLLRLYAYAPEIGVRDFGMFLVPIPRGPTSTSTRTTLAPSPGELLFLEESDLASASVFVHSRSLSAPGSGFSEFPIDLNDAAKRASLVGMLNGARKIDQLGNPILYPVRLTVGLRDGQEFSIVWYEHQPLALMSETNSQDHGKGRPRHVGPPRPFLYERR